MTNDLVSSTELQDCIYALAAGGTSTRQAIAVIRVSGANAEKILDGLTKHSIPEARTTAVRKVYTPEDTLIDQALVLWMPGPRSYTGEDSFELHVHGSNAIIEQTFKALSSLGARTARPGEFTKRAVMNSKMDVLQAEAIADLVEAETTAQASQALNQLGGTLSKTCENWAQSLRKLLSQSEALIDFPEDTSGNLLDGFHTEIKKLSADIASVLGDNSGIMIRDGISIALIGPPNAGKSTLFNALLKDDAAIVTPVAGTTRDALSAALDLFGIKTRIVDTAGIRETDDIIEKEGIKRSRKELERADLILHLAAPEQEWEELKTDVPVLKLRTKSDLLSAKTESIPKDVVLVSATQKDGLEKLEEALKDFLKDVSAKNDGAVLTRARHKKALEETINHLDQAAQQSDEVLLGEDLRLAMASLGELTGHVNSEMILDDIFGEFCIGK